MKIDPNSALGMTLRLAWQAAQRERRPRGRRVASRPARAVPSDVLIQAAQLDLFAPDARSRRMLDDLVDYGPRYLALAASGR